MAGKDLTIFFNIWVIMTLVVFYFGPISWPGADSTEVALYVLLCLGLFNLGTLYKPGMVRSHPLDFMLPTKPRTIGVLIFAFLVLSALRIASITGKNPILPGSYSLDFGQVYQEFEQSLQQRNVGLFEIIITLSRALLYPSVLLLFLESFRSNRLIAISIAASFIVSGLLRGTDKEFVDLFVLAAVATYYHGLLTRRVILFAAIAPVILGSFLLRRLGRFDGTLPNCLPQSEACFYFHSFVAQTFGQNMEILWVFVSNYLTQGYQALYYAFQLQFDFNFLVGHLPALKHALCSFTGIGCDMLDYQDKLVGVGWDTQHRWTSVYPVIANDVSFWGVPIYMAFLGVVYSISIKSWKEHKDVFSLAALSVIAEFFIYSSANMQIAVTLDSVFATLVFIYLAPFRRRASTT